MLKMNTFVEIVHSLVLSTRNAIWHIIWFAKNDSMISIANDSFFLRFNEMILLAFNGYSLINKHVF